MFVSSVERAPWGWALLAMVILAYFRIWPTMKKAAIDGESSLRHDLMAIVDSERAAWRIRENELRAEITTLKTTSAQEIATLKDDNAKLHGQIHELRNQMVALVLAAGHDEDRPRTPRRKRTEDKTSTLLAAEDTLHAAEVTIAEVRIAEGDKS